jgi:hypothetical protein
MTVGQNDHPEENISVPVEIVVVGSVSDCISTIKLEEAGGRGASNELLSIPFVFDGPR